MLHFTKLLTCRFRSKSAGAPELDSGYALLFVMILATVLLISLTSVLPRIYQEGQREREEELIFRGKQYARAVASFHQKFQRYPTSIGDLTKLTNGFRFLRKEYADPMTPNGKWRFIHANAMGVLVDSKTQGSQSGGQGQTSAGQGAGGFGMSGTSSMGGSAFGQQGMSGSGFGQSAGGGSFGSNAGGSTTNAQQNSAFFGEGNQGGGTFIVGVASTSHKQSIRIWNQKSRYDEWEFIGVDMGAFGIATSLPGLPQGVGGQSGAGDASSAFGQPGQGTAPGAFGQQPQGNTMTPGQDQGAFSPQ